MELFVDTRRQNRKISLYEFNCRGFTANQEEFTVGETKLSGTKKNLIKSTDDIRDALLLIGIILRQDDKATPVSDRAFIAYQKIQNTLLDWVDEDRPDRVVLAYESIATKIFAFTLQDGDRIAPTGWLKAMDHITQAQEERTARAFTKPNWDRFESIQNFDPGWLKVLKAKSSRTSSAAVSETGSEPEAVDICNKYNSEKGCHFNKCKHAHKCKRCFKDDAKVGDGHKCTESKKRKHGK